jgi:hypothetical protein
VALHSQQPGLWTNGHNIFLYHHAAQRGAPILCDFGVEVTRTFETAGEVYATETPAGEVAVAVHRGPYNRMNEAHDAIRKWMAANRRESAGHSIRRSGAESGRHRDDRRVSPKVAFVRFGRVVGIPYRAGLRWGTRTILRVGRNPLRAVRQ